MKCNRVIYKHDCDVLDVIFSIALLWNTEDTDSDSTVLELGRLFQVKLSFLILVHYSKTIEIMV